MIPQIRLMVRDILLNSTPISEQPDTVANNVKHVLVTDI